MAVISKIRKYVPKVGDNDKKPSAEQFVAYMKSVDVLTRQTHIRKFLSMSAEDITKSMMEDKASGEIKKILIENVVRFDNLKIQAEEGNGSDSADATMLNLWEMGEFELCLELFNEILSSSQLKGKEAKNSESQSGSTLTEAEAVH